MTTWRAIFAFSLLLWPMAAFAEKPGGIRVTQLRCEYMTNPLGIDVARPRLGWVLESQVRGQRQTAYKVLVAGSREGLGKDEGDLWDSGKVGGPQSVHVEYAGRPLAAGQRAWWKLRVWDKDGRPSAWSEPAWWEMGLLAPADWKARWISAAAPEDTARAERLLAGASWIWTNEGDPSVVTGEGERYFRLAFEVPANEKITSARLAITADDAFRVYMDGEEIGRGEFPEASEFDLAGKLSPGRHVLAVAAKNAGGTAGLIAKLTLVKESGGAIQFKSSKDWRALKTAADGWRKPGFDDSKWQAAKELGSFGCKPWGRLQQPRKVDPAPHMRKTFTLKDKVRSARAYVSGLGYYELYLNGQKVGDHVLDPGFTAYDKRVLYVTYDVTEQLHSGENAVGAILGNGWFNHHAKAVWSFDKSPWRDHPCLLAQLEVTYQDGMRETIATDDTWTTAAGPILFDGLFCGEVYDARREIPGWCTADFDAKVWKPVHVVPGPAGMLQAQRMPPIKVVETITPVKLDQPKPGVWVYDMGQAFAGWAQLRVAGAAGTKLTLKYGEMLKSDGMVDQSAIGAHFREAGFQTDTYILAGHGTEIWEPRFNYHGFRWVEATVEPPAGASAAPALSLDSLRGRVAHTAFEEIGKFECSNPLLNKIAACTRWSYGANFYGYPTDCPHREKNGWTGDAHLAAEQAMFNYSNLPAYEKWMNDLGDAQRESGELPGIVPTSGWGYHWGNGPAWDSAYVLIPWYLYEYCGDVRVLAEHYERMKRYVDYMTSRSKDGIVDFGLGDWVPVKDQTPVAVTSTGYYYVDAMIVAKAARLLGKSEDAEKYAALAERIKTAFNAKFYDAAKGTYANGSQTSLSCPLYEGLVPADQRQRVTAALVANIKARDGHLDCGILGAKYLLHALTDAGQAELAYAIVSQRTYPSYGHWIENGATTLWEDWKGESSRIHIMFGDVVTWMYQALAGIYPDPEQPGFEHVIIRPEPVANLKWAKAEYNSVRGRIVTSWRREKGRFELDLTIPPGAAATVFLPAPSPDKVTESGKPASKADGMKFERNEAGRCVYELKSGQYRFVVVN